MVAIDFPDTPTVGQVFDKWTWNGTQWVLTAGGGGDPLGAWVTPTSFFNGWSAGGTFAPVAYRKSASGVVYMRGAVTGGTVNLTAFGLAVGYIPATRLLIAVISNGAIGRLDIYTDGSVAPAAGSNGYFSFDGVSFTLG